MHYVHLLIRLAPVWGIAMTLVLAEFGWVLHRKRAGGRLKWILWATSVAFVVLTSAWFFFRGDIHGDEWVRAAFGPTR